MDAPGYEDIFRGAFDASPVAAALMTLDGRMIDVNPALCQLFGASRAELVGSRLEDFADPEEGGPDASKLERVASGGAHVHTSDRHFRLRDGGEFWGRVGIAAARDEQGRPLRLVCQIQDLSDDRRMADALRRLAEEDSLTGLANRRRIEQELDRLVAYAGRYGTQNALIVLDIDNFKAINDEHGHQAGDEVLRGVAQILRARLRRTDMIGRLGGDEFALVLPELATEQAAAVAQSLLEALRSRALLLGGRRITVTASAGVATFDGASERSPGEVFADADAAMFQAKRNGRDRWQMSASGDPVRPLTGTTTTEWPRSLERVCEHPELLSVVFQPLVDLSRGIACGYEALARFAAEPHEPPDVWFAAARRYGFAGRLEALALRRALAARSSLPPNCFLSVNVSSHALGSSEVMQVVTEQGELRGVVLEVEPNEVEDPGTLQAWLGPWRAGGAMLAVDDGGAAHGTMRDVMALRPEFVKVDRSVVGGLDHDDIRLAAVQTLGIFATRADAWLVAEGVERLEELDALVRLGVPIAQGYAISDPGGSMEMVPEELRERIRAVAAARSPG